MSFQNFHALKLKRKFSTEVLISNSIKLCHIIVFMLKGWDFFFQLNLIKLSCLNSNFHIKFPTRRKFKLMPKYFLSKLKKFQALEENQTAFENYHFSQKKKKQRRCKIVIGIGPNQSAFSQSPSNYFQHVNFLQY